MRNSNNLFAELDLDTRSDDSILREEAIEAELAEEFLELDLERAEESRILAMNEIVPDGLDHQFKSWADFTDQNARVELPEGCHEVEHF